MKINLFAISAITLLFAFVACDPKDDKVDQNELTVTGDVLNVSEHSATLTGYAYLPSQSEDAEEYTMYEVGFIYDVRESFNNTKKVVASTFDSNNKMFTATVTGLIPSTTYYYKSYVKSGKDINYGLAKSFETADVKCPEGAVDLGIWMTREDGSRYKLFWAKSNLRDDGFCDKPQYYGDYYAWGETNAKTDYNWVSYKFRSSGDSDDNVKISKYNTKASFGEVDNISELQRGENPNEEVDDVARAVLGGKWRMPTNKEWTALMLLKWEWKTIDGVNGRLVTADNGNSIFLPAAGRKDDTGLSFDGSYGYYWSSSLYTDSPALALDAFFDSNSFFMGGNPRSFGFPVRPVSE